MNNYVCIFTFQDTTDSSVSYESLMVNSHSFYGAYQALLSYLEEYHSDYDISILSIVRC